MHSKMSWSNFSARNIQINWDCCSWLGDLCYTAVDLHKIWSYEVPQHYWPYLWRGLAPMQSLHSPCTHWGQHSIHPWPLGTIRIQLNILLTWAKLVPFCILVCVLCEPYELAPLPASQNAKQSESKSNNPVGLLHNCQDHPHVQLTCAKSWPNLFQLLPLKQLKSTPVTSNKNQSKDGELIFKH